MRVDFHTHTYRSPDSASPIARILDRCRKVGIDGLAITDHNRIDGALEARAAAPAEVRVIVGEEIRADRGEIIGLFLTEAIPQGLSVRETVARIREQGGIVYLPHPFDSFGRANWSSAELAELAELVDVVEVFNARSMLRRDARRARRYAERYGLARGAGSDAHLLRELGRAYVEMPPFDGPADFLAALARGVIVGRTTGPFIHIQSAWTRIRKHILGAHLRR
ncbi:MAG: PHP domain-containing protein [Chloroflexi bacterium]|nr:PHP domain-containing protein [Chloroflexota bacterium]